MKQPETPHTHTPAFSPQDLVILRAQFATWTYNELTDYILRTLSFEQKKSMLNQLKRSAN